jgi:hypothetical protein
MALFRKSTSRRGDSAGTPGRHPAMCLGDPAMPPIDRPPKRVLRALYSLRLGWDCARPLEQPATSERPDIGRKAMRVPGPGRPRTKKVEAFPNMT